ncbi:N-6 DNA methylase [Streptomyces uncialis]|uniref:N-6 DNA methylase n=1 Tax=Streptomyces uncialis TaxID=1048205 RepID=UPI0037F3C767
MHRAPQLDLFSTPASDLDQAPAAAAPAAFRSATPAAQNPPSLKVAPATPAPKYPRFPTRRSSGAAFGDAIATAWYGYGAHDASRMDIPVGIVALLALYPMKTPGCSHAPILADFLAASSPKDLVTAFREVAARAWMERPDLIDVAAPILRWTEEGHGGATLRAIKAVVRAALRHGVLQYTGDSDPEVRSQIDLMSWAVTSLRHHNSRKGLGEYHTPPEVCDLMARMVMDFSEITPGRRINVSDPAAGTGGLLRAAIQLARERGYSPHDFRWMLQEIDPVSAAGAAVNVLVWDAGPGALVACGDTLAEGDLAERALEHQRAAFGLRDEMVAQARFLAALRHMDTLLDGELTAS